MRNSFEQRQYLHNLAVHSPGMQTIGLAVEDRCFVFHWPTLWRACSYLLAPLFGLDPRGAWEALRDAATPVLPGCPLPLDHSTVAHCLLQHQLASEEVAACTAPFDAHFLGRLPERHNHRATLAQLPHWMRQFIFAVEDLADVLPYADTGVWRDPGTNLLVINWALRAARYPFGHVDSPLRAPLDIPYAIANQVRHSSDVRSLVRRALPRSVASRCPWPDDDSITAFSVEELDEQYLWWIRRPVERSPKRRMWPRVFTLTKAQLTTFLDEERLKAWCKLHDLENISVRLLRLRTQWAMSLPVGLFVDKVGKTTILEDLAQRDTFIEDHRRETKRSAFYPEQNIFLDEGVPHYTVSALDLFARRASHYYVFAALRALLTPLNEDPTLVAPAPELQRQRVRDADRTRAPRWTAKEDQALKRMFSSREPPDEESWKWLFSENVLHSEHRTKKQVAARITTLNRKLRTELSLHGELTPTMHARFLRERLGQRNRYV